MNTETGDLYARLKDVPPETMNQCIPIDAAQMTKKQMRTMRVSKHDNRSELGQLFTGNRKERREMAAKARNKRLQSRKQRSMNKRILEELDPET
jgi:hypothetical protein